MSKDIEQLLVVRLTEKKDGQINIGMALEPPINRKRLPTESKQLRLQVIANEIALEIMRRFKI